MYRAPTGERHTGPSRLRVNPSACATGRGLAEEEGGKIDQVAAPDHPGVGAGGFDAGVFDVFGGEPGAEFAIDVDEVVVGAAGNPEQAELPGGFGVERGEFLVEFFGDAAGAEGADPGKLIEGVQASQQGFGAAHGEAGDGAGVTVLDGGIGGFDAREDFGE